MLECIRRVTLPEYDVFLSHASKDKPKVELLYKDLINQEFVVWFDKDNIHAGNDWQQAIQKGVENSKVLVLVWTENASKSDWVNKEITWASSKNIPIIPFLMDDTEPTISISNIQYIDASSVYASVLPKLFSRINTFVQIEVSEKNSKNFAWSYQKKPFFRSEFLELNNYLDVRDDKFALNDWTKKLHLFKKGNEVKAESFVSFCAIPIPNIIDIGLENVRETLQGYENLQLSETSRRFNHRYVSASTHSHGEFILYENRHDAIGIEPYSYIRFDENGSFSFGDSDNTFFDFEDRNGENKQGFHLIKILGVSWKLLNFLAYYYQESGYSGQIQFLINLRNTENKILAGFANESGTGWQSGLSHNLFSKHQFEDKGVSSNKHLQFTYNVSVESIMKNPELTQDIMIHLSNKIQWAFNLNYKPRHCMPDTEDFYWQSYTHSYYDEFI